MELTAPSVAARWNVQPRVRQGWRAPRCVRLVVTAALVLLPLAQVLAESHAPEPLYDDTKDAWVMGKVEMALLLNRYLNGFKISTLVKDGVVTLSGDVESDIDRDLAEQLTLGIGGVLGVINRIEVNPGHRTDRDIDSQRRFLQRVQDLTLTARVKSRLVLNKNVRARDVNVDTRNAIVYLNGEVRTAQERDLVIHLARNAEDVEGVKSNLKIAPTELTATRY